MTPARRELAAVFAGGAAGALARAGLVEALPAARGTWPWAIFAANMAGTALLGAIEGRADPAWYRRPLLGIGFCGGLTTFSTLQLELYEMLDRGRIGLAVAYAAISLTLGFAVFSAAMGWARTPR